MAIGFSNTMRRRGETQTRRHQAGNTILEAALVIVPFFAILFGIVDFGTSIFIKNTLQHAVASGVRYAVTYQIASGHCMDDSIRMVTQSNAMGFLGDPATPNPAITINYYSPNNLSAPLVGAANQPFNIVEVTANYSWSWLSTLTGSTQGGQRGGTPLNLVAYSSDRLGGLAPGVTPPCR